MTLHGSCGKTGKQKIITYTSTREEGLGVLPQYNGDTYEELSKATTFQEWFDKALFDKFMKKRKHKWSEATQKGKGILLFLDYWIIWWNCGKLKNKPSFLQLLWSGTLEITTISIFYRGILFIV